MTPARLGAWLALSGARGVSPAALRQLVSAFGDVEAVIAQPYRLLAEAAGDVIARAVGAAAQADVGDARERTAAWCTQPGNALVALDDPAYPSALLTMHDPPALLYVTGQLESLHAPSVAIVGSRNATAQGANDAGSFARELAAAGLAVVSGLALGIDAAAHRGALQAKGVTIAVVGTGADLVYPAQHRALAREIAARGAIVSEWPLGTPAKPAHFPQRNRLIAGLARGVLVIEAALRSGSLITARLANEMGRDVFAIPGSIHAPLSRGCHQLIKDGAKLTETPDDIFDEFGATRPGRAVPGASDTGGRLAPRQSRPTPSGTSPSKPARTRASHASPPEPLPLFDAPLAVFPAQRPLSGAAARLLDALGHAPAALEILASRTEMDSAALQAALLELELRGCIAALPGGRYARQTNR
ncbi:DNA-processing protein DprA [Trinickia sp.]|uniref:DNA-processing protein DprA n=1 Tax=Trinickia sp. TaxID=2571163 RepID=UPI003F80F523